MSEPTLDEIQCPYLHTSPECLMWHTDNPAPLNQTHYLPTEKPTLDEILQRLSRNIAIGVVTGEWIESNTKPQLTQLIADIIGEDAVHQDFTFGMSKTEARYRNRQKAEQRQRAKERGVKL